MLHVISFCFRFHLFYSSLAGCGVCAPMYWRFGISLAVDMLSITAMEKVSLFRIYFRLGSAKYVPHSLRKKAVNNTETHLTNIVFALHRFLMAPTKQKNEFRNGTEQKRAHKFSWLSRNLESNRNRKYVEMKWIFRFDINIYLIHLRLLSSRFAFSDRHAVIAGGLCVGLSNFTKFRVVGRFGEKIHNMKSTQPCAKTVREYEILAI